ncbi:MAG: hypothetical protein ACREST_04095, partial [Steroidobacteraceae bacterium]
NQGIVMKKRLISGLGASVLLAVGHAAAANATETASSQSSVTGRPQVTISDMAVFPNGPDVVGASVLTRYNTFIEATVSTTGLAANGAYSIWWVVFNNPQFCVAGCGLDDLPVGATPISNGDPRVRASLLWGGGFVANGTGAAEVRALLERNKAPGEVRFGPGLKRPRGAELHIVLRSHGPAVAGEVADQIGRFDGGCTPEEIAMAMCPNANVQFAAHSLAP